jgi:hypothetical protein
MIAVGFVGFEGVGCREWWMGRKVRGAREIVDVCSFSESHQKFAAHQVILDHMMLNK